jgi:hypothetical protein
MTHGRARDERRPISCYERVTAFPRPRRPRRPGGLAHPPRFVEPNDPVQQRWPQRQSPTPSEQ